MIRAVIFDMYETLITQYRCPRCFGADLAAEAGVPPEPFLRVWHAATEARSVGLMTLEEALRRSLEAGGQAGSACEALVRQLAAKRRATKRACFQHLHGEIEPLLSSLRARGPRVGLISNCFSEEAEVIRESALFPLFDAVCLSWEEGVQKPDAEIYRRCVARLGIRTEECLYVGDGGSGELEAAREMVAPLLVGKRADREMGMTAVQAVWYLKEIPLPPTGRREGFPQLETPLAVLDWTDGQVTKGRQEA